MLLNTDAMGFLLWVHSWPEIQTLNISFGMKISVIDPLKPFYSVLLFPHIIPCLSEQAVQFTVILLQ